MTVGSVFDDLAMPRTGRVTPGGMVFHVFDWRRWASPGSGLCSVFRPSGASTSCAVFRQPADWCRRSAGELGWRYYRCGQPKSWTKLAERCARPASASPCGQIPPRRRTAKLGVSRCIRAANGNESSQARDGNAVLRDQLDRRHEAMNPRKTTHSS